VAESREIGVSLIPSLKVRKLQETLHAKAKRTPSYRFYTLYDKLSRRDVLAYAYSCCQDNDGAPGVDGQTFADIEAYGWDEYANWHLGVDDEASEHTKARCKFPYGDFARVHRCGLLAAEVRAGRMKYRDIEDAAIQLRDMMDEQGR